MGKRQACWKCSLGAEAAGVGGAATGSAEGGVGEPRGAWDTLKRAFILPALS